MGDCITPKYDDALEVLRSEKVLICQSQKGKRQLRATCNTLSRGRNWVRRNRGPFDWEGRTPAYLMRRQELSGCLLLADADSISREQRGRELIDRGYQVRTTSSLGEACAIIKAQEPRFAIIDCKLSDGSGIGLIPRLITVVPSARIVVLSHYASFRKAVTALKMGATDFLAQPVATAEIDAVLRQLPDECRLSRMQEISLETVTRRYAERMLRIMAQDICATARALGIDTRTLRKLLARETVIFP